MSLLYVDLKDYQFRQLVQDTNRELFINDTGTERYVICNGSQDPVISLCRVVGFSFLCVKKYLLFALGALVLTGRLDI